jgi:hypothetical protein
MRLLDSHLEETESDNSLEWAIGIRAMYFGIQDTAMTAELQTEIKSGRV